ncbi:MAG TPA: RcpC/CpaB family pilus assembly protein [Conexibacter sp.]|nr:RcpC/CpaB family pilus assembly protein [Conexibacter sp.]
MTPRRRALLLLALALLLGTLAAASMRRREAALARALGPNVLVLVTRAPVAAGAPPAEGRPLLRPLPRRYAPPDAIVSATRLAGAQTAVPLPAGSILTASVLRSPGAGEVALGPGERVAEVVAHGDPRAILPGARVDVLVTREGDGSRAGATVLALEDLEVLAAHEAPADPSPTTVGGRRVVADLRVRVRDAVYLAAAQTFAQDIRLLARAAGDRSSGRTGLSVDERLR